MSRNRKFIVFALGLTCIFLIVVTAHALIATTVVIHNSVTISIR
jgi:hypothetical protein